MRRENRCGSFNEEKAQVRVDMATVDPFPAAAVEAVCRILGEAVIGSQIPNLIAPLKVAESSADMQNTK